MAPPGALRLALSAAAVSAACGLRSLAPFAPPERVRCVASVADNASAHFETQLESSADEAGIPQLAIHYAVSSDGLRWRRLLTQHEGPSDAEVQSSIIDFVENMCTVGGAARAFVSQMAFDFVGQLVLAFAADEDTCGGDFGGGLAWRFKFRRVAWGSGCETQIRVEGGDGREDHTLSMPSLDGCPAESGDWTCDIERTRVALASAWGELLEIRLLEEQRLLRESVRSFLGCSSLALRDCRPPAAVQRLIQARLAPASGEEAGMDSGASSSSSDGGRSGAGDVEVDDLRPLVADDLRIFTDGEQVWAGMRRGGRPSSEAAPTRRRGIVGVLRRMVEWLASWTAGGRASSEARPEDFSRGGGGDALEVDIGGGDLGGEELAEEDHVVSADPGRGSGHWWRRFDLGERGTPLAARERHLRTQLFDAALLACMPTRYLHDWLYNYDGPEGLAHDRGRGPVARAALLQLPSGARDAAPSASAG